mmetsp:Transcript_7949/g.7793  ORF Transcript_7949/g.7793 Transcript_7949/m.7793 type:complete len:103 (-) Transcript_7949:39-347(-)
MHLLLVDSEFLICSSTEVQNHPYFPGDDALLSADPCGSFALSFVDFGWNCFFLLYSHGRHYVSLSFFVSSSKSYLFSLAFPSLAGNIHDSLSTFSHRKITRL